jgi:hypothetical protein
MNLILALKCLICIAFFGFFGCGDSDEPEDPGGSGAVCDAGPQSNGIRGRIVVPSCFSAVSAATVTVLDGLQRPLATVVSDENGEFVFATSQLQGDGTYILIAEKGPFRGPARPEPFEVSAGRSAFQLVTLATD